MDLIQLSNDNGSFVRESTNGNCTLITCVVCLFSSVILRPSPNILLHSWKAFFVHLHYFKTSAALGFKLCIRVPIICKEISKQISRLNNSVGSAVEACSFMRVLIGVLKCWKPNSFTIALSCYFLPNCIFAIYISSRDPLVQLSQGNPNVDNPGLLFKLRCFLSLCGPSSAVAEIVWSAVKPPCPSSSHIPSYLDTRMDMPSGLLTWPLGPIPSTPPLCDTSHSALDLGALPDYKYPDKSQHRFSSAPRLQCESTSIYSCLGLTWKTWFSARPRQPSNCTQSLSTSSSWFILSPDSTNQREIKSFT